MTSMALQSYPAYRPSNVPWLGSVPEHWEVWRLKHAVQINPETLPEDTEPDYVFDYMDINSVGTGYMAVRPAPQKFGSAPSRARRIVRKGDTTISTVRTYLKATYHLQEEWPNLIASTGFAVLRPPITIMSALLGYAVQSHAFVCQVMANSVGVVYPAIGETKLGTLSLPLPPLPEQHAIARYLDYVDRRIRRYVSAKRRLIALLEEERQAIVNQAVTRGLDPSVRLKPSGVEWLGDVPEHWDIPRLRNLGEALIGLTYNPQDVVDEEEGILVLRASNVRDGQLVYGDNVFVRSAVPNKLVTLQGDILICSRSGSRTLIGKNARINADSAGTTFGAFMTVFRGPHNNYLHRVFNSRFFEYQSAAFFTSTINQLTLGILYNMKVPFPPLEERQSILRYVGETTAPIDRALARARRQIELVQEYRTRLIADVVTGKVDVREAAALLPEEGDEPEPIDEDGLVPDNMEDDTYDMGEPEEASESEVTA